MSAFYQTESLMFLNYCLFLLKQSWDLLKIIYYYRHKYKDGLGETCCICVNMHMGGKGETERKETETIRDTEREIPSVTHFHQ